MAFGASGEAITRLAQITVGLVVCSIFGSVSSLARAATQEFPLQENESVLVRGPQAQISVSQSASGSRSVTVRGLSEAGWKAEHRNNALVLEGPEGDSRRALAEQMKTPAPRPTIEIVVPAVPLDIDLREGAVTLNRGSAEARVHLKTGRVTALARAGLTRISVLKGDVVVSDGTGGLDIDVYQGNVSLKNLQTESEVRVFNGSLVADSCRGQMSIVTTQGSSKVIKFNGSLQFENGRGAFTGTALQGRIEGSTLEGTVTLQAASEAEIHLKSQSGRVNVALPALSGAAVNLVTNEGEIVVPSDLRVNRTHLEKSARGKLKGEPGRFSVTVRSQESTIQVK